MRFPDHFIEEVKSRVVLSDIIGRRHKVVRSGKSLKVCCPFHNEKSPSCYLYDADGHYHCFGCGAHGDAIEYLMSQESFSFHDALVHLAKEYGLALPEPEKKTPEAAKELSRREELYDLMEEVSKWYERQLKSEQGKGAFAYLKERSFTGEIVSRFRIGFAPGGSSLIREFHKTRGIPLTDLAEVGLVITESDRGEPYDRFRGRLMFPILDKKSRIIGFGGRQLGEGRGPKYLNSPETVLFHKGAELYGHPFAARSEVRSQPVIVCEGYTDVMSLHQAGYHRAVAPLGTALTQTQISLLWRLSKKPVLCFDGDMAGGRAAERAAETALSLMTTEKTLQFLSLPEGEDPASLLDKGGRDRFQRLLETKCRPVVDMLWQSCVPLSPPKTPEEQAKIKKKIVSLTSQIKDHDLKESYYSMLKDFYTSYLQNQKKSKSPYGGGPPYHQGGSKYGAFSHSSWGAKKTSHLGFNRMPSFPVARPELDASYMKEAILMFALLNFPSLIRDYEEEIAHFKSETPCFEKLKECLLEIINEDPDLDREALKAHLYERGFKKVVDQVQGPKVSVHASFAHPEKNLEEVRPFFQVYIQSDHTKEKALEDMKSQTQAFALQMSSDEWQKIQHRRRLIASTLSKVQSSFDDHEN